MKSLARVLGTIIVLTAAAYALHATVWVPYRCNIAKRDLYAATVAADALLNPVHRSARARENLVKMEVCSRKCPADLDLRMMRGANWEMLGRYDMAVGEYQAALRWDDRPEILRALGLAQAAAGDRAGASKTFVRAVLFDPKYYGSIVDPGLRQDVRADVTRLHPRLVLPEHTHQEYFQAGVEAESKGDLDSAAEAFARAVAVAPRLSEYSHRLATVLQSQQKPDRAAAVLNEALVRPEEHWIDDLNLLLGDQYRALNRMPDAVLAYERAVAAAPGESFARIRLGGAYRDVGRFEEARKTFRGVADSGPNPQKAGAYLELALTEEKAKNRSAAIAYARQAVSLAPHEPSYATELNRLLAAGN